MAATSLFEFRAGAGLLHRLDPRAKLGLLFLFSMTAVSAGWLGSIVVTILLYAGLRSLRIPLPTLLRAFRFFIFFLGMIVLTRALVMPGTPLVEIAGISLSAQGLARGSLTALRFFNMMVLGLIFSATTRPSALAAALQWAARPVPMVPETRLAMIFSLALSFLPMILGQAGETAHAFKARNGHCRKNPIRRTVILVSAVINRVLDRADAVAMAMEARCYTHHRTTLPFKPCGREKPVLLAGMALCAALLLV